MISNLSLLIIEHSPGWLKFALFLRRILKKVTSERKAEVSISNGLLSVVSPLFVCLKTSCFYPLPLKNWVNQTWQKESLA